MEQATFLFVVAVVGYICYKWGFDEGVIATSEAVADSQDQGSADA